MMEVILNGIMETEPLRLEANPTFVGNRRRRSFSAASAATATLDRRLS
jgi:hypothetical protein